MSQVFHGGRVVVVGGGIIGCAIAFSLSQRGHRDVLILERGAVGEGATAHATGGIRTQFSTRVNIELVQRSMPTWHAFDDVVGATVEFREHGYLFLLTDSVQHEIFQAQVALQRSLGVAVDVLDPADVAAEFPGIRTDDLLSATYTPRDGSASPHDAVQGFLGSARRNGVEVREHTPVTAIDQWPDGSVRAVRTDSESFDAECVIVAAGPQSGMVGQLCDLDIPVVPHSRQAFATGAIGPHYGKLPLTVDMATGAYLHPEPGGRAAVIGGHDRATPSANRATVNWDALPNLVTALVDRFPGLADVGAVRGWAGLREMTPDDHAVVGPVPSAPGLWVAAGFSGHGFMQSPAVGEAVASTLIGEVPAVDLTPLRPERFADAPAIEAEKAVF